MSSDNGTRLSLLQRASDRESVAWSELVDLYAPLVAYWCRRRGVPSADLPDIVQDVFMAVSRRLSTFQARGENGSFRSWLWTITSNKILDHGRRVSRHISPVGGSSALMAMEQVPDSTLLDDEPSSEDVLQDLFRRGLAQVRDEFETNSWQAFWRTAIDGIPTATVAEELKMTPAAIRQARSRILRRLRQQLGDV
jgi:RNA polymerase sigma-70 factor (ECF subfamily)